MDWNNSKFIEAFRLINKFFPERKAYLHKELEVYIDSMISAMKIANFKTDYSCEAYEKISIS